MKILATLFRSDPKSCRTAVRVGRNWSARLDDQLLGGFIRAQTRGRSASCGFLGKFPAHVFHGGDGAGVGVRRGPPIAHCGGVSGLSIVSDSCCRWPSLHNVQFDEEKVSHWASSDVVELEKAPNSATRQAVIAEIINAQTEDDRNSVRNLAEAVKLKESAPATGLDIGRLTALEVQLGKITVTSGTGARIEEANVGTFKTGDISVGDRSGK